jgi:YteA family regulatory protein
MMKKKDKNFYKKRLIDEKNALLDTIDSIRDYAEDENQQEQLSELSMIDNHPADVATEMEDREKSYALIDNEKKLLNDIQEALERIDQGTYGVCRICGSEISDERLDFIPYTSLCIDCEKSKETEDDIARYERPAEEDVLGYPFGRKLTTKEGSFMDAAEDYNGFDGEDSWQDVDRFNQREGIYRNYDDDYNIGCVEPIEHISNTQYKNQLP